MKHLLLVLCLVFLFVVQVSAHTCRTWYVLPDSTGDAPTIQEALNRAGYGDDILVAAGTYHEHDIIMKEGVWLHSEWGPDETTIDAQQQGCVLKCTNVYGGSIIEGFTITGGSQSGIHCSDSSPIIKDNTIRNNTCGDMGGGIGLSSYGGDYPDIVGNTIVNNSASNCGGGIGLAYYRNYSSTPRIRNNTISNNSAPYGAGIYCSSYYPVCSLTVSGNTIEGNSESNSGGGLYLSGGSLALSGNTIEGNSASNSGGGVYLSGNSLALSGNTIESNSASNSGGGLYLGGSSPGLVDSNRVVGNSAGLGGGIYCGGSNQAQEIRYNALTSNSASKGGGIYCENASPRISGSLLQLNRATGWGGGIYCYGGSAEIADNVVSSNTSSNYGGGVSLYSSYSGSIHGNTIVLNSATRGGGISLQFGANPTIGSNIVALSAAGGGMYCYSATATSSCNDIWSNAGGDAICGTDGGGNFSHDPEFCNAAGGDYTIDEMSPCAPGNSPSGCGLIGALPVGCAHAGVPSKQAEGTTWGSVKSMYK